MPLPSHGITPTQQKLTESLYLLDNADHRLYGRFAPAIVGSALLWVSGGIAEEPRTPGHGWTDRLTERAGTQQTTNIDL